MTRRCRFTSSRALSMAAPCDHLLHAASARRASIACRIAATRSAAHWRHTARPGPRSRSRAPGTCAWTHRASALTSEFSARKPRRETSSSRRSSSTECSAPGSRMAGAVRESVASNGLATSSGRALLDGVDAAVARTGASAVAPLAACAARRDDAPACLGAPAALDAAGRWRCAASRSESSCRTISHRRQSPARRLMKCRGRSSSCGDRARACTPTSARPCSWATSRSAAPHSAAPRSSPQQPIPSAQLPSSTRCRAPRDAALADRSALAYILSMRR